MQAAVILTRKGGGGAGPERGIWISLNMDKDQVESHGRFCGQNKLQPKICGLKSILCQASEQKINSNKSKVPPIDLLLQHGNIKGCKWRVMQGRQWQCGELRAVYCISVATCSVQSGLVLAAEQEGKWLVQDKECTSSGQTSLLLVTSSPCCQHQVHTVR